MSWIIFIVLFNCSFIFTLFLKEFIHFLLKYLKYIHKYGSEVLVLCFSYIPFSEPTVVELMILVTTHIFLAVYVCVFVPESRHPKLWCLRLVGGNICSCLFGFLLCYCCPVWILIKYGGCMLPSIEYFCR